MVRNDLNFKNTKVIFRFLPMLHTNWENIKILEDRKTVYIRCMQDFQRGREHLEPSYWKFCTDGLFYNSTQEEIYSNVTSDGLFEKIIEGNNAIILSYGQTGSGKSLTTAGLQNTFNDRGIIPRVIENLFKVKDLLKSTKKIKIQMSYVETNKNYVLDLLSDHLDVYDMISMKNVKVVKMKNEEDALKTVFKAEANKTFRMTDCYSSNMANSVLTLIVSTKCIKTNDIVISKFHIVDLSGADTIGNVSCLHKNGFEVGTGNLAKTQLEQFILVLNENNTEKTHCFQRLCVIINYLKDALNANSLLRFIGHIRAPKEDLMITLSMLRCGQLVQGLKPQKLLPNIFIDQETQFKQMDNELSVLKKERDLNSMLINIDLSTSLSQDHFDFIEHLAEDYINDKNGEVVLLNTTDAILVMKVFKHIYNKVESERKNLAEQVKLQEDGTTSRLRDSSLSSKPSKRSSLKNSSVSLVKKKKSISKKKTSKTSKKDFGSILEGREESSNLKRSRSGRRRRKSTESSVLLKSENSNNFSIMNAGKDLPENVPDYEAVWMAFIVDSNYNYNDLKEECDGYDEEIVERTTTYNEEASKLQEMIDVARIRKDEVYKAHLLNTLIRGPESDNFVPSELEVKCLDNVKLAEKMVLEQKELLLKLQAELRLCIDSRNKIKEEIDAKYEEFSKQKFQIAVPNLDISKEEDQDLSIFSNEAPVKTIEVENVLPAVKENLIKTDFVRFNELRRFMKKEYNNRIRREKKSQQWIQSCKLLGTQ